MLCIARTSYGELSSLSFPKKAVLKGNYEKTINKSEIAFLFLKKFFFLISFSFFFLFFIVVCFVMHWNESAMDLHVFPIPIPPPTSVSTRSL